ncbi:LCP family protein [Alkalibacter mobilis]|uniref:LCP family protein n=1 Tax=Alkalibacter mobilis TaxID=2787712 RepID=UPI00189D8119|nr:LCP family protein [Alkalibacter mobilis]MBF7096134.1 LCP family protein [Alkalibacter mobilis]
MPSAARIRKNKRDKKRKVRKIITITLMVVGILAASGYFYLNSLLGQVDQVEIDEEDLGVVTDEEKDTNLSNENVLNFALFGIDTRDNTYDESRSDSIIIATLDLDHKKIKLTSLMRDTYVSIPGEKYDKIGHAYAYGGPSLAIKTINTNYDMNITDFATVNFKAMEKIVDSVGGVEITVTAGESQSIPGISGAGTYTLNGQQAVAFSRIRKIGTDFARTERQREVLEKVINKLLKDRSITKIMSFADSLLPYVQTSLSRGEILSLATKLVTSGATNMEDSRLPIDGHGKDAMIDGVYYLKPSTLEDNVRYLHSFIYENEDYVPTSRMLEISEEIGK